ncbi:hypothetical protein GGR56DRAFT_330568 [Xylariaceae sp. FL0804]|nr:hypothetical protein GGR56DRAFT_330568 [Xylariaceae sp. FL0804]
MKEKYGPVGSCGERQRGSPAGLGSTPSPLSPLTPNNRGSSQKTEKTSIRTDERNLSTYLGGPLTKGTSFGLVSDISLNPTTTAATTTATTHQCTDSTAATQRNTHSFLLQLQQAHRRPRVLQEVLAVSLTPCAALGLSLIVGLVPIVPGPPDNVAARHQTPKQIDAL